MTQPATTDDVLDNIEPTDDEIAAAAADEQRDATAATRALRKSTAPARRGPGRPPGSKTRKSTTARSAAKTAQVRPSNPKTPPANSSKETEKEAAERKRAERAALIAAWTDEAMARRPQLVRGIGLVSGMPAQFLVEHDEDGKPRKDAAGVEKLTQYGDALAPQPWQVKAVIEGGVRVMETEQGEKLVELFEKLAPYFYGTAACAALALYTVTVLQATKAIKPMIDIELQQMLAAQQAAQAGGDGAPGGSAGPTG